MFYIYVYLSKLFAEMFETAITKWLDETIKGGIDAKQCCAIIELSPQSFLLI